MVNPRAKDRYLFTAASSSIHVSLQQFLPVCTFANIADRAASVLACVWFISAVQTLEQTHIKSKLYTTCLGDWVTCANIFVFGRKKTLLTCALRRHIVGLV